MLKKVVCRWEESKAAVVPDNLFFFSICWETLGWDLVKHPIFLLYLYY